MTLRFARAAMAAVMLVAGCSDYSVTIKPADPPLVYLDSDTDLAPPTSDVPELSFSPPVIDFGYVEEGTSVSADVLVTNLGLADLEVTNLITTGSTTFSIQGGLTDLVIPGGSTELFTVVFTPANADETGAATFASNDPYAATAQVLLEGTGADRAVQGSPNPMSFGNVSQGQSLTQQLDLINVGNAPVTVTSVLSNSAAFVPSVLSAPVRIPVGSHYLLPVTYTATQAGGQSGVLQILSDARRPAADVDVNASGVANRPTAACSVDPTTVVAIHESATWKGVGSSDPNGRPLTYAWTLLSGPAGTRATMPSGGMNRGPFTPDVVGDYTARLVVTNDRGEVSDPCDVTLHAEPNASLWVEMFWARSGDDMDLHLVANGGSRNSSSDCYYANCVGGGPNWGVAGTRDNAFLDLDDIPGTGPENINIAAPADGFYRVDVHDYPGSTYNGNNQVRVRIYIDGILLYDQTKVVSGESSWTSFARIDWSGGVGSITPM